MHAFKFDPVTLPANAPAFRKEIRKGVHDAVATEVAIQIPAAAPGTYTLTAANLQTALETGRAVDQGWRVRKDGSRFWADVVITPIFEDDGRLRRLTANVDGNVGGGVKVDFDVQLSELDEPQEIKAP